jgi:hypothetical protein
MKIYIRIAKQITLRLFFVKALIARTRFDVILLSQFDSKKGEIKKQNVLKKYESKPFSNNAQRRLKNSITNKIQQYAITMCRRKNLSGTACNALILIIR